MGLENQFLISRSLDLGLVAEARQLQQIDRQLYCLLKQMRKPFDFVGHIADGDILLVGEGNLSFALSLARKSRINAAHITATTFEKTSELSDEAIENAVKLRADGATVLHSVNAGKISAALGNRQFDHIIFQFPHTGSREPVRGHNPNSGLVRSFLKSAISNLRQTGTALISAVDTPHYHGAFRFDEAAVAVGFKPPEIYRLNPDDFPGYRHTMTHLEGDALSHHNAFATWLFRPE